MQLYFGVSADGRVYPDTPNGSAGAVGAAVVGPAGLMDMLEAQLGLLGPAPARAVRIASYVAKLRVAGKGRFWSASFAKDPWSTASSVLGWRDALVAGGWRKTAIGSTRVDDLADVESAGPPLPLGIADRAATVLAALPNRTGLQLSSITLLEPRARLPPLWSRLVDALEATGVPILAVETLVTSNRESDLARVQRTLSGRGSERLVGDGSFTLVEADTALMAAEAVADWLAAGPAHELEGTGAGA